jgi:hypothetical protein
MKSDSSKAMQEALNATVARMHNGTGNGAAPAGATMPAPTDLLGLLVTVLPKLLQNNEASEEMIEKLDEKLESLQKGDLTALREQVLLLRKQCHRLLKGQAELLGAVHEIQKQQGVANEAIVELAQQMSRMQIIDPLAVDDGYEERYEQHDAPGGPVRNGGSNDGRRPRQKAVKNQNRARS